MLKDFETNIYNFDIRFNKKKNENINNVKINLENLNNSVKTIQKTIKMQKIKPDIFINCSYPISKDWVNNSFKKIKISVLKKM